MSYSPISVKEAIGKINKEWFLPAIQRPYVWGSRYESELYICRLFDSLLKGYPIGGLIIWMTDQVVPYRKFIEDYSLNTNADLVDLGLQGKSGKGLVYDGQQRLQTLFSCLKHSFNNKILVFNLRFQDLIENERDQTGFSFVEKTSVEQNNKIPWYYVRLNELFAKSVDEDEYDFQDKILESSNDIPINELRVIKKNISMLWKVFVKDESKSLSFFPVSGRNESIVNDIFERLNTGGMALSLGDLVFMEIKKKFPDFEERLVKCSQKIYKITNLGFLFSAYSILQLLNLIIKGSSKLDYKKIKSDDPDKYNEIWKILEQSLVSFFKEYLHDSFKINNSSIVPRNNAMLPIMVYFYILHSRKYKYCNIGAQNKKNIDYYFITSQINDWNLQSYIDNISGILLEKCLKNEESIDFPIDEIKEYIKKDERRNLEITENNFLGYEWFTLKILTPSREFVFDPDIKGRFNPEIDHIFPKGLKGQDEDYKKMVDVVWNMQPTTGEVNLYKSNIHPKLFFTDKKTKKECDSIKGSKYLDLYDYLFPVKNGKVNFNDNVWDNPKLFIKKRRELMVQFLTDRYGITLLKS